MKGFFVFVATLSCAMFVAAAENIAYPNVTPNFTMEFPRDAGSHPDFRTEWWYVTGWLQGADKRDRGFQITFFRVRPNNVSTSHRSKFAAQQILFAHVALSDPSEGKLIHAERAARAGFGLAQAKEHLTHVWIQDWSLQQMGNRYLAKIATGQFTFDFEFNATSPPMLHGVGGYSQKAPNPLAASYYYSIPNLLVSGTLTQRGKTQAVSGTAWLDHEWSSEYMDPRAVGWDWAGINFDDGAALMAFRMRDRSGGTLWAGGSYRSRDGTTRVFKPEDIAFTPIKHWRSPRTNATYPISAIVRYGDRKIELTSLFDDQELDSDTTARAAYWEGAVRATQNGKEIGRGYLELTGYAKPLKF